MISSTQGNAIARHKSPDKQVWLFRLEVYSSGKDGLIHMTWIIGCLGILVLGAGYGYGIGAVAKRRAWSGKKVKIVALVPIPVVGVILMIASKMSREASGSGNPAAAWAEFPWTATLLAGFLAVFVAAHVAYPGVSVKDLDG
jgi:hypothetical protein